MCFIECRNGGFIPFPVGVVEVIRGYSLSLVIYGALFSSIIIYLPCALFLFLWWYVVLLVSL